MLFRIPDSSFLIPHYRRKNFQSRSLPEGRKRRDVGWICRSGNYCSAFSIFTFSMSSVHFQKVVTSPVTVGMSTRWELAMMMFWR